MSKKVIRRLVYASLFCGMAIVLKVFSINLAGGRISLLALPILLAGYYLGPAYGLAVGFVTDTVYMIYYGSFWNLYTVSTMIWGLSGAILKNIKLKHNIISIILVILVTSICETTINTFAELIVQKGNWAPVLANLVTKRLPVFAFRVPILMVLTKVVIERLKVLEINFQE